MGGFVHPDPWQGLQDCLGCGARPRRLCLYWDTSPVHELTVTEHLLCTRGSDGCSTEEFSDPGKLALQELLFLSKEKQAQSIRATFPRSHSSRWDGPGASS